MAAADENNFIRPRSIANIKKYHNLSPVLWGNPGSDSLGLTSCQWQPKFCLSEFTTKNLQNNLLQWVCHLPRNLWGEDKKLLLQLTCKHSRHSRNSRAVSSFTFGWNYRLLLQRLQPSVIFRCSQPLTSNWKAGLQHFQSDNHRIYSFVSCDWWKWVNNHILLLTLCCSHVPMPHIEKLSFNHREQFVKTPSYHRD